MSRKWFSKRKPRIDPDEMARVAEESLAESRGRQVQVNAITSYLDRRQGQNGFGEDFEITLIPRSA